MILRRLFIIIILYGWLFTDCSQQRTDPLPFLVIEEFNYSEITNWKPNYPQNWRMHQKDDQPTYQLLIPEKKEKVRAPTSRSIFKPYDVKSFKLKTKVQCMTDTSNKHRDICLFFGYQDSLHYYYTHFSGASDDFHNIIALVNNSDRMKINMEAPGTSIAHLTDYKWHNVKIIRDVDSGSIEAYIDDIQNPALTAIDKTLGHGRIGLGSFDDTGNFAHAELWGQLFDK